MAAPLLIYFFSGTGNARNVAHWFAETATGRDIPAKTIDIAGTDRKNIASPPPGSLVGFVSPTHGFNYPPAMMYFIFRFPLSRGNRAFLMNTRAGMKLSKWFVPGLSGIALWLSAIVLLLKGYRIVGPHEEEYLTRPDVKVPKTIIRYRVKKRAVRKRA